MGENPPPLGEDLSMLAALNKAEVPINNLVSRKPSFGSF